MLTALSLLVFISSIASQEICTNFANPTSEVRMCYTKAFQPSREGCEGECRELLDQLIDQCPGGERATRLRLTLSAKVFSSTSVHMCSVCPLYIGEGGEGGGEGGTAGSEAEGSAKGGAGGLGAALVPSTPATVLSVAAALY